MPLHLTFKPSAVKGLIKVKSLIKTGSPLLICRIFAWLLMLVLLVSGNCLAMPASHACCGNASSSIHSQDETFKSLYSPEHAESSFSASAIAAIPKAPPAKGQDTVQECCQPHRLILAPQSTDPNLFLAVNLPLSPLSGQVQESYLQQRQVSLLSQRHLADVARRRCLEFCVLLN
ncbi:MAG: hypothetical protein VKJ04_07515 [Vampirovibrionales bacterium]|nr:hypothetical protein [Vampirovibrionales bacterium]